MLISFCPQPSEVVCLALLGRSLVLSEVLCVCDVKYRNDGRWRAMEAGAPPLMSTGASANHPGRLRHSVASAERSPCLLYARSLFYLAERAEAYPPQPHTCYLSWAG